MDVQDAPRRIGRPGRSASGRPTVAELWRGDGHCVIDLDAHSRAVLDLPGDGVEETVARFGEAYRNPSGTIDRAAMARLVFGDSAARAELEGIVLSRVERAVAHEEAKARAAGERLVIHDNPLLLEKRGEAGYARVTTVLARREDRIARVVADRGRDRAYVESVMADRKSTRLNSSH